MRLEELREESEKEGFEPLGLPLEEMGLLYFVRWDRYTVGRNGVSCVFGWIDRADGRFDFVVLEPDPDGLGFTTSSAERSEEISTLLNGGEPTGTHNPCRRVEDAEESALLENVIRLPLNMWALPAHLAGRGSR